MAPPRYITAFEAAESLSIGCDDALPVMREPGECGR
jgi:hypothetical protein